MTHQATRMKPMKFHRRLYSCLSCIFERMALFVLWIADGEMYERPLTRLQPKRRRRI